MGRTPEELRHLVKVDGERGILYLVAAFTGLRRGEFEKIQWRDVHFDEAWPYISVLSSIAKNAKLVPQPLPLKVALALPQLRQGDVASQDLVFKRLMRDMDRFRDHLRVARIAYVDEKGDCAQFHSLRKTFATELAKLRLPLRVAMELMRHSDPNFTTKIYTDAGMLPIWDAVGALPMFNDTQIDTPKVINTDHGESTSVPVERNEASSLGAEVEKLSPPKTSAVIKSPEPQESAPCRNRTCNPVMECQRSSRWVSFDRRN